MSRVSGRSALIIFQETIASDFLIKLGFHYHCILAVMQSVFAADTKSDSSTARRQISFAAGADARCNSGATQGCLRSVAVTHGQLRGHIDTEIQHTIAVFLVVLTLVVVAVFYYIFCLYIFVMYGLLSYAGRYKLAL